MGLAAGRTADPARVRAIRFGQLVILLSLTLVTLFVGSASLSGATSINNAVPMAQGTFQSPTSVHVHGPFALAWVLLFVAVYVAIGMFSAKPEKQIVDMPYSELVKTLDENPGTVTGITVINGTNELLVDRKEQPTARVVLPGKAGEEQVLSSASKAKVPVLAKEGSGGAGSFFVSLLFSLLPIGLLILFFVWMSSRGGAGGLSRFQQTGATRFQPRRSWISRISPVWPSDRLNGCSSCACSISLEPSAWLRCSLSTIVSTSQPVCRSSSPSLRRTGIDPMWPTI